MSDVASPSRFNVLLSPLSGTDPLRGPSGIPAQPVVAAYRDSYDEADRAAGLALFDRRYRQDVLAELKQSLSGQPLPAARRAGFAAVAC